MLDLHPDALNDLKHGSGLSEEIIAAAGIHDVPPSDLQKLGAKFYSVRYAYALPYRGIDGKFVSFQRLKLFPPVSNNGHPIRYYQAPNSPPHLYLPPNIDWEEIAANPARDMLIAEGEKKGLAGSQVGLTTAAIGGCWNFRVKLESGERIVIPTLDRFVLKDRRVELIPDSDGWRDG